MTDTDLPPVERLQAIHLEPGDTLIVTLPDGADRQALIEVAQLFGAEFPDHRVCTVGYGVGIHAVRHQAATRHVLDLLSTPAPETGEPDT